MRSAIWGIVIMLLFLLPTEVHGRYVGFQVSSETTSWQNSRVHVNTGEVVLISAFGDVQVWADASNEHFQYAGPIGTCERISDSNFVASGLADRGLIAKIGSSGIPFDVGSNFALRASSSGELYFAINETKQGGAADNRGSWDVGVIVFDEIYGDWYFMDVSSMTTSWQNTGVQVHSGDRVDIVAAGLVQVWASSNWSEFQYASPNGTGQRISDSNFVASGLADRGLIGKIGADGTPFNVGAYYCDSLVNNSGTLYLAINETTAGGAADNQGFWHITINVD